MDTLIIIMDFIRYSNIYFIFSGILILASIAAFFTVGLKPGIDFIGGNLLEVEFKNQPPLVEELRKDLSGIIKGDFNLQETGENGIVLRAKEISDQEHQEILEIFKTKGGDFEEKKFEMISSVVGNEFKNNTIIAIILSCIAIMIYIALAFRHASRLISSWQYSVAAVIALLHNVLITCGVFVFLGKFINLEINIPFVAALLTVIGYSINDTIVIFDRCRENLNRGGDDLQKILNRSLTETIARSIFVSFTTLLTLFAILFWGGETLFPFVLTLIVGIATGTYSSIFIATPLLYKFANRK